MLFVKTRLGPSAIHGIGLFADQFIPKGTLVQQHLFDGDSCFSVEAVMRLPEIPREAIRKYAYLSAGYYMLSGDDTRFLNHSATPNLLAGPFEESDMAARDIELGEELTVNYFDFDEEAELKLKRGKA